MMRSSRLLGRPSRGVPVTSPQASHRFIVIAMLCAFVSACTSAESPPDVSDAAASACSGVSSAQPCSAVVVNGRSVRYSIVPKAADGDRSKAVLVDLGGPGRVLFAGDDGTQFARVWPGRETLILLEEPWVSASATPPCLDSLRAFYEGIHAAARVSGDGARQLAEKCQLGESGFWGWSPDAYRGAVEAILAKERLQLAGVVSSSFGATRSRWLSGVPFEWQILDSPSPYEITGRDYLAARSEAASKTVARVCKSCDQSAPPALRASIRALNRNAVAVSSRSLAVNGQDLQAALLALPYLPPTEQEDAAKAILRPQNPDNARTIGLLSDSVLLRYGVTDMSPAALAYLQEVCGSFTPWDALAESEPGVDSVADRFHQPCQFVPRLDGAPNESRPSPARRCLASSSDDAVTPPAFAERWVDELEIADTVTASNASHGAVELAVACYRKLVPPPDDHGRDSN